MRNKIEEKITESVEDLRALKRKVPSYRVKTRLESLILIKGNTFKNLDDIAAHLSIGVRTLNRWLRDYYKDGIESTLQIGSGGKRRCNISPNLHEALKEKLHNAEDPFLSYSEAVTWVQKNYSQTIKYNTLRMYLIRQFKSKLKQPRKSHYKKDDEAIAAFKKTAQ